MHIRAVVRHEPRDGRGGRPHLSASHVVRAAQAGDVADLHALLARNAERGLVLPRTEGAIAEAIEDFIAVTDGEGRVVAGASLQSYSPSLAEVAAVVVADDAQGTGLGSIAVRGVEALARRRGVEELFAVTHADRFFASLGYERTLVTRYPEKLARYAALAESGVAIVPRSCFRKAGAW